MRDTTRTIASFPSTTIPSHCGGLPVQVSLIAQLGPGSGDQVFAGAEARQRAHEGFVDALDEPSSKLAGTDFAKGEHSSLFSFAVGPQGHPFHRHAGHRVFTAISGSGGAQLRFSTASPQQLDEDPRSFLSALRYVDIPPDCLFTVRFGGGTWHQFAARKAGSPHPVFFALSCHTNELGGDLPEDIREQVIAGSAGIATLTELLPPQVQALLDVDPPRPSEIPTVALSLHAPKGSAGEAFCRVVRHGAGRMRRALARRLGNARGFVSGGGRPWHVESLRALPEASLLADAFEGSHDHQDMFRLTVRGAGFRNLSASALMEELLQGFLERSPPGVSVLMRLRNFLVRPLRLRTSPLGCPVSSLLSQAPGERFAGRFPVLRSSIEAGDRRAQVLLGADDRHLAFRSCVGVHVVSDSQVDFTLGTRVRYRNVFGHAYMALIDHVHRAYIAPAMLRNAVKAATEERGVLPAVEVSPA